MTLKPDDAPFAGAPAAFDDRVEPDEHDPTEIATASTATAVNARVAVRTPGSYHPL